MITVVGNSIAALAAVSEISKNDATVWIRKRGVCGGVFGGVEICGELNDIGMVNFELSTGNNRAVLNLQEYDRTRVNDCANFSQHVSAFVSQFTDLALLPEPQLLFRGQVFADFLFGHRLDVVRVFRESVVCATDRYTPELFGDLHPKNKYQPSSLTRSFTFQDVSRRLLGDSLYDEVVDTWLQKVLGDSRQSLPLHKHRTAWAPLYYPESIIAASKHGVFDIGLRASFTYPTVGSFAALIRRMFREVSNRKSVTVIENSLSVSENVRIALSNPVSERVIACDQLSFSEFDLDELQTPAPRSVVDLVYVRVGADSIPPKFYIMNSCEVSIPWYRTSISSGRDAQAARTLCFETAPGKFLHTGSMTEIELARVGIDHKGSQVVGHLSSVKALHLVDEAWDCAYAARIERLAEAYPKLRVIGGAASRWSNTFSDQVIQGVRESQVL